MTVLIIAEAGVNHNACLETALSLVDAAVDAGADIVKFQTAIPSEVVTKFAEKADYQKVTTDPRESQLEMTKKIHLPLKDFFVIRDRCNSKGIEFLTTSFGPISSNFISQLDMRRYKIPSGEISNLPYLRYIGSLGNPIILSTGMSTLGDIEAAIGALEDAGTHRSQITLLHCTTEYPAPMNEVNLRAMQTIEQAFGVAVGYSDHTVGIEVPIAAVAMGATLIEKHFTLSRDLPGPDHKASLEPKELREMVTAIRNIETALGDGIKQLTISESKNQPIARKSIVASIPIRRGEIFTPENVTTKRPGIGISPMCWDSVIGKEAKRDFAEDELIET
jgi:N,N'-diacetyllegionaminate synthase